MSSRKKKKQQTSELALENKKKRSGNEAYRIRFSTRLLYWVILLVSGMLMSASMPPLNWSFTAWIALIPLVWIVQERRLFAAWFGGWLWGLGWVFTGFFWLREIDPAIPFMIAPILALWPAFWALAVPFFYRGIMLPVAVRLKGYETVRKFDQAGPWRELAYVVALAAWWCVIEWTRSRLLPWNYLSTSQWRNLPLLQLAAFTGTYGISFLLALANLSLFLAVKNGLRGYREGKFSRPVPFIVTLILLMLVTIAGSHRRKTEQLAASDKVSFRAGVAQGDISQRRRANDKEAKEALDVYMKLSYDLLTEKPDIVIWPETAVPFPFRAAHPLCRSYRYQVYNFINTNKVPMLLGTVDFEELPPGSNRQPGTLNSAFLFDKSGFVQAKYDKVHPVPFGEYVPFREYLPQWAINAIDMHRDLTPGNSFEPLPVYPGVKAGINICFEDVFAYISRREMQCGANLLLVITNDAWYPKSSEPEQHLANSVCRAVETGLPMLRCGNNSASCLIQPNGHISACLFEIKDSADGKFRPAPETRGRKAGIIKVSVPLQPRMTFYTRFGDWFVLLCALLTAAATAVFAWNYRKFKTLLMPTDTKN